MKYWFCSTKEESCLLTPDQEAQVFCWRQRPYWMNSSSLKPQQLHPCTVWHWVLWRLSVTDLFIYYLYLWWRSLACKLFGPWFNVAGSSASPRWWWLEASESRDSMMPRGGVWPVFGVWLRNRRQESSFVWVCFLKWNCLGSWNGRPCRLDCRLQGIFCIVVQHCTLETMIPFLGSEDSSWGEGREHCSSFLGRALKRYTKTFSPLRLPASSFKTLWCLESSPAWTSWWTHLVKSWPKQLTG